MIYCNHGYWYFFAQKCQKYIFHQTEWSTIGNHPVGPKYILQTYLSKSEPVYNDPIISALK